MLTDLDSAYVIWDAFTASFGNLRITGAIIFYIETVTTAALIKSHDSIVLTIGSEMYP